MKQLQNDQYFTIPFQKKVQPLITSMVINDTVRQVIFSYCEASHML